MEKLEELEKTLIEDLNAAVNETNAAVTRVKAHGFDKLMELIYWYTTRQNIIIQGIPPVIRREPKDQPATNPAPEDPPTTEVQPTTEAPPAPEVAPAPEELSTATAAPEAPPAPMPAEDPGPSPRRRGRPRKIITDDATPSLLPHSEPPATPAEVAEPAEPVESVAVTDAPQDMADDLPW